MANRTFRRALLIYAVASLAAIAIAGGIFAAVYEGAADRRAILVSAAVALVVQVGAFSVAWRMSARGEGIAGWTLGAVICLVGLMLYAFASRALGLPSSAALLSLATFFFITELIEPPLLNV